MVGAEHPEAADEDGHLRRGEVEKLRFVEQKVCSQVFAALADVVAETVCHGLEYGEGVDVGLRLRRVRASG